MRRRASSAPSLPPRDALDLPEEQTLDPASKEAEVLKPLAKAYFGYHEVERVIKQYRQLNNPSVMGHNAALHALVSHGTVLPNEHKMLLASDLYEEMLKKNLRPTAVTFSYVISAYAGYALGLYQEAASLTDEMRDLQRARVQAVADDLPNIDRRLLNARNRIGNGARKRDTAAKAAFQLYASLGGNRYRLNDDTFIWLLRLCVEEKRADLGTSIVWPFTFRMLRADSPPSSMIANDTDQKTRLSSRLTWLCFSCRARPTCKRPKTSSTRTRI
jgi:hypothetical protein